jgi:AcrR family transcriptional regulator
MVVGVSRLSRAELQLRTRAKVLAAARAEFAEHGYRDAKIDRIADRAELTRGAVYSNFPGKRALYFTVLAEPGVRRARSRPGTARSAAEALSAFADTWLAHDQPGPEVVAELSDLQAPYAELLGLNALLLGLSLDHLLPGHLGRSIRTARLTLTMLTGAAQLAANAPGFVQPLAVARACADLAHLELDDPWRPPPTTPPTHPANELWSPPSVLDEIQRRTADLGADGVVAVLGLNRLAAAEDVVRSAAGAVTIALVSSHPDELGPLARSTVGVLLDCLWQSVPRAALPGVRLVHDETGLLASTIGCEVIGDDLEYAVRTEAGRIVARAEGFGAGAAIAGTPATRRAADRSVLLGDD